MKLNEIAMDGQEPMILAVMRTRMSKGERVARYYRSGSSIKPMWIVDWRPETVLPPPGEKGQRVEWVFRANKANNIDYFTYDNDTVENHLELVPGKTPKTWQLKRRAA